jgi:cardiolipin synthase
MKMRKRFLARRKNRLLLLIRNKVFSRTRLEGIHGSLGRRIAFNWERTFTSLFSLGGTSFGNTVQVHVNGDEAFMAKKEAIASAKHRVWMETYIFEPDSVGRAIRDELAAAAARGCDVILIYDHFGSSRVSNAFWAPLIEKGAKVFPFNPIWPWRKRGPLLFRNHRKILIVDDRIAFCGGMNISEDYTGPRFGNSRFRDTVVSLEGPCVDDLAELLISSLRETSGEDRSVLRTQKKRHHGMLVQVLGSNTRRNLQAIQHSMQMTLKRATHYCYFTTPYFLPYDPLRKAIIDAAERGVDVRVLTAGLSDIPLMRMAGRHAYGQFLKAGVRIFEMFDRTLHAKTASIDGVYGTVGSFNLDHWSARRNLEVTVSMWDAEIAQQLEHDFQQDLVLSQEVIFSQWEQRSWFMRIKDWFAYQLMRL